MPVAAVEKQNGYTFGFESNIDKKTMFSSDPLLSKSNNNKISEQKVNGQKYPNGIGYLDSSRRRFNSASTAHSATENGRINNGTSHMNGHSSHGSDSQISFDLANAIISAKCSKKQRTSGWMWKHGQREISMDNVYVKTILRTVDEISGRHEALLTSMVKRLNITRENHLDIFTSVVDDIFSDGETNWGRIVTVYALAGKITEFLVDYEMEDCLENLADHVGNYVNDSLGEWMEENGGWDGFVRFFPDQSEDEKSWNGSLLLTACGMLGAGLAASLYALKT